MVETRAAGRGIIVDQMMITRFVTIPVFATLRQAVDLLLEGEQREFPVVDNAGVVEGNPDSRPSDQGARGAGPGLPREGRHGSRGCRCCRWGSGSRRRWVA